MIFVIAVVSSGCMYQDLRAPIETGIFRPINNQWSEVEKVDSDSMINDNAENKGK